MNPDLRLAALAASGVAVAATAGWMLWPRRLTAEEKERRRRLGVNRSRRTIEGFITDCDGTFIQYRYSLRGVTYMTSQDISTLAALLPPDPSRLIGEVSVKYDPANPANSIVVCEEWSGLPHHSRLVDPHGAGSSQSREQ